MANPLEKYWSLSYVMRKFRKEHCSVQEAFASNIQISPHLEKGQKRQRKKKHKLYELKQ